MLSLCNTLFQKDTASYHSLQIALWICLSRPFPRCFQYAETSIVILEQWIRCHSVARQQYDSVLSLQAQPCAISTYKGLQAKPLKTYIFGKPLKPVLLPKLLKNFWKSSYWSWKLWKFSHLIQCCKTFAIFCEKSTLNSSPHAQNGRHFADDIFRRIFVNDKFSILIKISLKFVPKWPIDNTPVLV